MQPLLVLLLVPVIAQHLLWLVVQTFGWLNRAHDRTGIEGARKSLAALGFGFEKCRAGSSWFMARYQTSEDAPQARFRSSPQTGLAWVEARWRTAPV